MDTSLFDYCLPEELVARRPAPMRTHSRLFVLKRVPGVFIHERFYNIKNHLRAGDLLVLNDSRVFPARLIGRRLPGGGKIEALLLKEREHLIWEAMVRPGKKIRVGDCIVFHPGELEGEILEYLGKGERLIRFICRGDWDKILNRYGHTPLPPYILKARRDNAHTDLGHTPPEEPGDRERYQTVYARDRGSVAAPTAGFHFSENLMLELRNIGVNFTFLTLHIGPGTFKPVTTERIEDHEIHTEYYRVTRESAEVVNETRRRGGRIIPVGTTVVRTLETCSDENGIVHPGSGETSLMIMPGYRFRCADALITNFHLPRSTLLLLVSAFGGVELIRKAYGEAIAQRYRFYSYGDAMLIL